MGLGFSPNAPGPVIVQPVTRCNRDGRKIGDGESRRLLGLAGLCMTMVAVGVAVCSP
jgi:hypothetical protein